MKGLTLKRHSTFGGTIGQTLTVTSEQENLVNQTDESQDRSGFKIRAR